MLDHYHIYFRFRGEECKAYVTTYPDGSRIVSQLREDILQDFSGCLPFDAAGKYTGTYQRNKEATDLAALVKAVGGQLR